MRRQLTRGRWTIIGAHEGEEAVHAEPFAELELELQALWPDPPQAP